MKNKFLLVLLVVVLVVPAISAFAPMANVPTNPVLAFLLEKLTGAFVDMTAAEAFALVVGSVVGLLSGVFPNQSIFGILKKLLKLKDQAAHVMVYVTSALLGAFSLWVTGAFAGGITIETVFTVAYAVYGFSQIGFKWMKSGNEPEELTAIKDLPKALSK